MTDHSPIHGLPYGPERAQAKKEFAQRLYRAMTRKGWHQSQLAKEAEKFMPKGQRFTRDNVSGYVHGRSIPEPIRLSALAQALGVQPNELVPSRGFTPESAEPFLPRMAMKDMGDGMYFVQINQPVSMATALKLMADLTADGAEE